MRRPNFTDDSRKVSKGDIFFAIQGITHDGNKFIDQALQRGASQVIKGKNVRQKLGEMAANFYDNPSRKLKVIGVTGTKGKTTTAHLIYYILTSLGKNAGLISSISVPGLHVTTPDVVTLNQMLAKMVEEGKEYAVIEVSSHGIDQERISGVRFEVAVLTNIAPEHLDYHKTFENYKKTKLEFLKSAKHQVSGVTKTALNFLPGQFNNLNAESAVQAVSFFGIKRDEAVKALKNFELPQGRLEEVKNDRGLKIIIDFAHTPDSLEAALKYLKGQATGRLISVFGCAGERDPRKRSQMGKISSQYADLSIFTAEDPRTEDIFKILGSMKRDAKNFLIIPERSEAIAYALENANMGDLIAFFGKGHEKSMGYKGWEHPWSDREYIESLLDGQSQVSAIILAAGKGSRMNSYMPKVLHEICGRPMIAYTLECLRRSGILDLVTVVSYRKNLVMKRLGDNAKTAYQKNPKGGTADATKIGLTKISKKSKLVVVINGDDSAFYTPETIKRVIQNHIASNTPLTFVSLIKNDPTGLGRVVRDKKGNLVAIVEEKEATELQKKITEVNDGLYVFDKSWLTKNIDRVKKGQAGEYYLVDLIKLAVKDRLKINVFKLPNDDEWHGINTQEQLRDAQLKMEKRLRTLNGQ